ncbi:hypothetical protein ASG67_14095 [Sphingomonas sp. Leaf339]|nr:hypothetical protein ASG67_14095 [Sphingomonas sp. Leaf339]
MQGLRAWKQVGIFLLFSGRMVRPRAAFIEILSHITLLPTLHRMSVGAMTHEKCKRYGNNKKNNDERNKV